MFRIPIILRRALIALAAALCLAGLAVVPASAAWQGTTPMRIRNVGLGVVYCVALAADRTANSPIVMEECSLPPVIDKTDEKWSASISGTGERVKTEGEVDNKCATTPTPGATGDLALGDCTTNYYAFSGIVTPPVPGKIHTPTGTNCWTAPALGALDRTVRVTPCTTGIPGALDLTQLWVVESLAP